MSELQQLEHAYRVAKELGLHKNEYWSSVKRTIDRMIQQQRALATKYKRNDHV